MKEERDGEGRWKGREGKSVVQLLMRGHPGREEGEGVQVRVSFQEEP